MNEATPHEHRRIGTNVTIRDERNAVYEEGLYDRLPPKRQIAITAGYDGWIEVWRCGRLMDTSAYTALTDIIRSVDWQTDIRIYQGLDLCAQLRFERPVQRSAAHEDETILNALKTLNGRMIPLHHSAGSIAPKMRHLSKTTSWFRKQMRAGRISETALKYLQKQVGRHQ